MGSGWFTQAPKALFDKANELNEGKQIWATEQLQKTHGDALDYKFVYNTTKLDVRDQVQSELSSAAVEATLAVQFADTTLRNWTADRQTSKRGRASQAFQESMTILANFLENFSGIVEIVRAADDQYGGLAYGTLSVFIGVFVRKTQREEKLMEGFEELSYAFPRLQTLRTLGLTHESRTSNESAAIKQLEKLLTETFVLVIKFAREATQYYASRTRRFKDTFVPERVKFATFVEIRSHLEKVRDQCDTLMLTQISSLQEKIHEMNKKLNTINTGVIETGRLMLQSRMAESQTYESKMRKLLGIDPRSGNIGPDALASLEALIHESFSKIQSATEHPRSTTIDLLKADEKFGCWWESQSSSLLLAGGVNWREESSTGVLNWLSLGALLTIKELQGQHKNVAHYLVQPNFTVHKSHRRSLRDVMASLIFQIIAMREDSLRIELDTLGAIVDSSAWKDDASDEFMEAIHSLLLSSLSVFPQNSQIWIVIDRLDQCSRSDGKEEDDIDVQTAVERLLSVLVEADCCVKVFLVVGAPCAGNFARSGPPLSRKQKECLKLKPQWRQETEMGRV